MEENKFEHIQTVLDGYFKAWNEGFISKDGERIRAYMSEAFWGYWAHAGLDKPEQYNYSYDLNGVLGQYDGEVEKSFEPSSIIERNNGQEILVYGRESNRINGKDHPAQCLFIWRQEGRDWKLVREYIELVPQA